MRPGAVQSASTHIDFGTSKSMPVPSGTLTFRPEWGCLVSRMNWSRARGEKLVRDRGFEPVWEEASRADASVETPVHRTSTPSRRHVHAFGNWKEPLKLVDSRRYRNCSTCGFLDYEGPPPTPKTSTKGSRTRTTGRSGTPPTAEQPKRLITSGRPPQMPTAKSPARASTESHTQLDWLVHCIQYDSRKKRYFCTCPWPGTRNARTADEAREQHKAAWAALGEKSRSKWQRRAETAKHILLGKEEMQ